MDKSAKPDYTIQVIKDVILCDILIPSLQLLYAVDYDNIRYGVSERNICARLAHHMENMMRDYDRANENAIFQNYFVDVEYNRMGNGDLKYYENSNHLPQYMVSDLLIQSRGVEANYLAVEMKRENNLRNSQKDKERLISLVSSPGYDECHQRCVHDTLIGAFIVYSPLSVKIILYENMAGVGRESSEILLRYDKMDNILKSTI